MSRCFHLPFRTCRYIARYVLAASGESGIHDIRQDRMFFAFVLVQTVGAAAKMGGLRRAGLRILAAYWRNSAEISNSPSTPSASTRY